MVFAVVLDEDVLPVFAVTVRPFAASQEWKPRGGLVPVPDIVLRRVGERAAVHAISKDTFNLVMIQYG